MSEISRFIRKAKKENPGIIPVKTSAQVKKETLDRMKGAKIEEPVEEKKSKKK